MKALSKVLSVVLILAAAFGVYGSTVSIKDILDCKAYWEEEGKKSDENLDLLDDGVKQLKENSQAYVDGVKTYEEGVATLTDGKKQLAAGKTEFATKKAEAEAGEAKLKALEPLEANIATFQQALSDRSYKVQYQAAYVAACGEGGLLSSINTMGGVLKNTGNQALVAAGEGLVANVAAFSTNEQLKSAPVGGFAIGATATATSETQPCFRAILQQVSDALAQTISEGKNSLSGLGVTQATTSAELKTLAYNLPTGYEAYQTPILQLAGTMDLKDSVDALLAQIDGWTSTKFGPITTDNPSLASVNALGAGIVKALLDNALVTDPEQVALLEQYDTAEEITAAKAPEVLLTLSGVFEKVQATIDENKKALADGKVQLAAAEKLIAENEKKLADGEVQLAEGKTKLGQFEDGEAQLIDGLNQLMATETYTGLKSIKERLGEGFSFMQANGKNIDLDKAATAVKTGREFSADSGAKITKEIATRAVGQGLYILGALFALIAGFLGLAGKKGAKVLAAIALVSAAAGIVATKVAGTEMSLIAGSTVAGAITGGIVIAVAALLAVIAFASNKAEAAAEVAE